MQFVRKCCRRATAREEDGDFAEGAPSAMESDYASLASSAPKLRGIPEGAATQPLLLTRGCSIATMLICPTTSPRALSEAASASRTSTEVGPNGPNGYANLRAQSSVAHCER